MNMGRSLVLVLLSTGLFSCSGTVKEERAEQDRLESQRRYQLKASQSRTREQGVLAASAYGQEVGFAISRYDLPIVRAGLFPHYGLLKHFGAKEYCDSYGTLSFYRGWNAEMDRLLLKRFGGEYKKYRKTMLPPLNSGLPRSLAMPIQAE